MSASRDGLAVAHVCIPHTMRDYYDYLLPEQHLAIGSRVQVSFINQLRSGLVVGQGYSQLSPKKLKKVVAVLDDAPLLDESMLRLLRWVARYYQSPLSEVLALVLPRQLRSGKSLHLPQEEYYQLSPSADRLRQHLRTNARRQHQALDYLARASQPVAARTLYQAVGKSAVQALLAKGLLTSQRHLRLPHPVRPTDSQALTLNPEQAAAVQTMTENSERFQCFLLQGVTGSGKTEVYLQVIARVLAQNRQVLVLVPEIGLTPQLISRFQSRFALPMAVLHSHLNDSERSEAWLLARAGVLRLIIGTRTAVFTPLPDLGLIVIDEEHDASLKQMDGVRYSARDTALMRASQANIPLILGTATPSLESLHNAQQGKYRHLHLQQKALQSSPLLYRLVDIRNTPLQEGFAVQTLQQMAHHLQAGNQVLVFLNRRGFAPVILCHLCGKMLDCPDCDSHLTYHHPQQQLRCHHCGFHRRLPSHCPHCKAHELIRIGVGTQRLEQFLQHYFPAYPPLRIDRDTVQGKDAFDAYLQQIHSGAAQLIIGTQMLAKGHHFPHLTLAVILDADAGLSHADFRASERLGQLLLQVAGRAGRAEKPGEVIIQTHQPQHPLLNTLIRQGYDAFAHSLLASRQQARLPPWHYLALLRGKDKNLARLMAFMQAVQQQLQSTPVQVLGPAPSPLARKAGEHQLQLLFKSDSRGTLQQALTGLRQWLTMNKLATQVHWSVDVDPQELA
ncbi:MAG: primosomal protein N' [Legionellaceae bacterium]|nr:primosomal protein N' [Legionellaceae bacterium]